MNFSKTFCLKNSLAMDLNNGVLAQYGLRCWKNLTRARGSYLSILLFSLFNKLPQLFIYEVVIWYWESRSAQILPRIMFLVDLTFWSSFFSCS